MWRYVHALVHRRDLGRGAGRSEWSVRAGASCLGKSGWRIPRLACLGRARRLLSECRESGSASFRWVGAGAGGRLTRPVPLSFVGVCAMQSGSRLRELRTRATRHSNFQWIMKKIRWEFQSENFLPPWPRTAGPVPLYTCSSRSLRSLLSSRLSPALSVQSALQSHAPRHPSPSIPSHPVPLFSLVVSATITHDSISTPTDNQATSGPNESEAFSHHSPTRLAMSPAVSMMHFSMTEAKSHLMVRIATPTFSDKASQSQAATAHPAHPACLPKRVVFLSFCQ